MSRRRRTRWTRRSYRIHQTFFWLSGFAVRKLRPTLLTVPCIDCFHCTCAVLFIGKPRLWALIYATAEEADAYMFYRCFFLLFPVFFVFFPSVKNTRQPFSGTAERIFMKLLPNDSGENVVSNIVPKWGLGPPNNFWGLKTRPTHCELGGDAWRVTEN